MAGSSARPTSVGERCTFVASHCSNRGSRVTARITPAGAKLLAELDGPVLAFNRRWFGHLGEAGLAKLMELLDEVRRAREG